MKYQKNASRQLLRKPHTSKEIKQMLDTSSGDVKESVGSENNMHLDFFDTKPKLTWNPRSWKQRFGWFLRKILKDKLP